MTAELKYLIVKEAEDKAIAKYKDHHQKTEKIPAYLAGYIEGAEAHSGAVWVRADQKELPQKGIIHCYLKNKINGVVMKGVALFEEYKLLMITFLNKTSMAGHEVDLEELYLLDDSHVLPLSRIMEALERIKAWEFATDGRKFDGNHKEVLKQVISIAKEALSLLNK